MKPYIEINGRRIGIGYPTYIIAEMSANHNQNFKQAVKIIEAAKEAGANAIKLQTYTSDTMTIDCDNEYFKIKGTIWEGNNLYKLYEEAYTTWEWQPRLEKIAEKLGLVGNNYRGIYRLPSRWVAGNCNRIAIWLLF